MYKFLFPLVEAAQKNQNKNRIPITFMTGFEGEKISLCIQNDQLVVIAEREFNDRLEIEWLFAIKKDGSLCFRSLSIEDAWIEIDNDTQIRVSDENKLYTDAYGEERFDGYRIQDFYYTAPAIIQLMLCKWDTVISFLTAKKNIVMREILDSCVKLFKYLSLKSLHLKSDLPIAIVNPIMTSQDSYFTWQIEHDQTGIQRIQFVKKFSRPYHEKGERIVIISHKEGLPNQLEISFKKTSESGFFGFYHEEIAQYSLDFQGQEIVLIPKGKYTKQEHECLFVLTSAIEQEVQSKLQDDKEIEKDVEFILKTLSTIHDLIESPHTLVLQSKPGSDSLIFSPHTQATPEDISEKYLNCYNLEGEKVPLWWILTITKFPQSSQPQALEQAFRLQHSRNVFSELK